MSPLTNPGRFILLDGRWAQSHRLEAIRNGK